jgi:plastocyanin
VRRWWLVVGLGGLLGCFSDRPGTGPSAPAAGVKVTVADFAYVPPTLTVQTGDTVTWTNTDNVAHTVTANNDAFDSGVFGQGKTFQITAGAPGTYSYFCQVHPFMKGTLTVTP